MVSGEQITNEPLPPQHVQDLEEERMEFIKDNVWLYANSVSSVCVTDDEASRIARKPDSDIV